MFNPSAKKFYLTNSFTGFQNVYNTKVVTVESNGNTLTVNMNVNPAFIDFESLSDRIYTTVTYNLVNDTFTIKCEGKGSRKYNSTVKREVTDIINHLVELANSEYKNDCIEARHMTNVYYHNELSKVTTDTAILNELYFKVNNEELNVSELHEYVTNKVNELQPTNKDEINTNNNESFTVGNISFPSYSEAEAYCITNDFEPELMIIKEVAIMQPSQVQTVEPLYNYKDTFYFNSYDVSKLTEKAWNADINKHNAMYYKLKELHTMNPETLQTLINDNYSFYIEIANNNPYKKPDMYMINITLLYMNRPFTTYINRQTLELFIQSNNNHSDTLQPAI